MPFTGVADENQLAILAKVFDDFCRNQGLIAASPEREDVATLIMSLFGAGKRSPEELKAALATRGA